ncbi:MAG: porin [Rhodomicrobium sp.]
MSKVLVYAFTLAGLAASAQAANLDIGSVKDPLPDALTWNGVTLYGTIDVGYGYQSHGAPLNGSFPQGVDYNIYSSKYANKAVSSLDPNATERSAVGLKIDESIGGGWVAVAKLETSFDPLTGELSDGPASLLRNAGVPLSQQSANGDSGRAGQAFNGPAYAGVSNASYGSLTAGRQQSLQLDASSVYDPQGLSYAFSLLGWSSSLVGSGITEAARWDNSMKYVFEYGPVHAAAMYSDGGPDTGFFGPAYGFDAGGSYRGFSIDAVYQKVTAAVQLAALTQGPATGTQSASNPPPGYSNTELNGLITDNDSWSVQGKYTFDFGGGLKDGGYKDDLTSGSRLTVFGGFEDIRYYNSSAARDKEYIGQPTIGGYIIGFLPATATAKASSLYFYASTRELELEWTGVRYALPSGWSFTAAYYHLDQLAFSSASKLSSPQAGSPNQQAGYLAGSSNDGSFVVDYQFNKHFDVYAGVNYSTIDGGLASGYLANENTSVVTGARLKF